MRRTFIHEHQKNPGQSNQPDGFAGPFPAGCPFGYEWLRAFDHVWIEKELTGKDQLKKMLNVHFKTAWKFPETGGKSRQKAEKTYSFRKKHRKEPEKRTKSLLRDQKAVGKAADDLQWRKFRRRLSQPKRAICPVDSRDD